MKIVLTNRTIIAIVALGVLIVGVSGLLLSNYLVPSSVVITAAPGISVFYKDPQGVFQPALQFQFGDVQQNQFQEIQIAFKNSAGSQTLYIIDQQSLRTTTPLPQGVSLTWNFLQQFPAGYVAIDPGVTVATGNQLMLRLSADGTAVPATLSFTTEFRAFSTPTG